MEFNIINLIKWFQLKHSSIVKEMSSTSHHYLNNKKLNPYHLEGDIWAHTMLVMLEANRLKSKLDHGDYIHLLICALLHDIGKPLARKVNLEKQRVHFWGHEPMSAFLSISILLDIEKDFSIGLNKRLIMETIAMHTDVYNVPREKLEDRLINNKKLANMLSYLSECDYSGRFFEMGERNMEHINPDIDPSKEIQEGEKRIYCLVGLPCSGKSTFFKNHITKGQEVLSRDDIVMELAAENGITSYNQAFSEVDQSEVDRRFQERKNKLKNSKNDIWIDMTNMSRKSRRKHMQDFKNHKKSAIVVVSPLNKIYTRNKERKEKTISDHVYEKMIYSFQPPLYDEFDQIDWVFNGV